MTIEQISDKTILFGVDYRLEPTAGTYYGESISVLSRLCKDDERMQRLADACNTLAAVMHADLTLYQTDTAYAFVLYRHLFDVEMGQLHFLEQIAKNCDALDMAVSTVYAQTVCVTAWIDKK